MSKSTPSTCLRFVFSLALLLPCAAFAQGPAWKALGPFPAIDAPSEGQLVKNEESGRVLAIAIHPTDEKIVFIGTAGGGLYLSQDAGKTWTAIDLPSPTGALSHLGQTAAVGAIAFAPKDPTTIFVGTGQRGSGGQDAFFGVGVYVIRNATSATPDVKGPYAMADGVDAFTGRSISAIAVDPTNSDRILVSTGGSGLAGVNGASAPAALPKRHGLYRSTNALSDPPTFTRIPTPAGDPDARVDDVVLEPGNSNAVICTAVGFDATDGGIYRSEDIWDAPAPAFLHPASGTLPRGIRSRLAINRVGTTVTVLLASTEEQNTPEPGDAGKMVAGTVRRSTDGGKTFEAARIGAADGFAAANLVIEIDPTNADIFYLGGSAKSYGPNVQPIKQTVDGGKTFTPYSNANIAGVHDDTQVIKVAPSKPSMVYDGGDGGMWRSNNSDVDWTKSAPNWSDINLGGVLSATQLNTIAQHPKISSFLFSGAQDNGSPFMGPDGTWAEFTGGDGGPALIDQNATATSEVTVYYCNNQSMARSRLRRAVFPAAAITDAVARKITTVQLKNMVNTGFVGQPLDTFTVATNEPVLFYNPITLGPGNPNSVYFGTDRLRRSGDKGATFDVVSQAPLVDGARLSAIGVSLLDDNVRLVGLDNGRIFATTSGATTLNDITVQDGGKAVTNYVTKIVIDPTDKTVAYAAFSGFNLPNKHVWRKRGPLDAATPAWEAVATGIPDVPVNALAIDPTNANHLYAGTDIGVYNSTDGGATWAVYGTGFPRTAVRDMGVQQEFGLLRIATYGRGVWEIPLASRANTPTLMANAGAMASLPAPGANSGQAGNSLMPAGTIDFSLSLSMASAHTVTFDYMTVDGQAVAGVDYVFKSGQVVFNPGDTQKTISVQLLHNPNAEPSADFAVEFTDATGGFLGAQSITGTILSGNPVPEVSIDNVSVTEGSAGTTDAVFTVSLPVAGNLDVSVDYTTVDVTTDAGNDYVPVSGTVTIPAGQTSRTITVKVKGDTLPEADETFLVRLSNPTHDAVIAKADGLGTILNDDGAVPISTVASASPISLNAVGAAAQYPASIDVTGVSGFINKVTVCLNNLAHAYPDDLDILLVGPGGQKVMLMSDAGGAYSLNDATLTFDDAAAATLPQDGQIVSGVFKPTDYEPGDPFAAPAPVGPYGTALSAFNGLSPNGTWKLFIMDDTVGDGGSLAGGWSLTFNTQPDPSVPSISVADIAVTEGNAGTVGAVFKVRLSAPSAQTVTVNYETADGTATAPADYVPCAANVLTFAPGITERTVVVQINGSTDPEPDQTFFLNLTGATNAVIADNQARCTIVNDDVIPEININDLGDEKVVRTHTDGSAAARFTVTLSEPSTQEVRVDFTTEDGDAIAGTDYTATSGNLIFPPGATSQPIDVQVLPNNSLTPGVVFTVKLSNPVNGTLGTDEGDAQISREGDGAPEIDGQPMERLVQEGDPVSFTVEANGAPTLTYQWRFNDVNIPGATGATLQIGKVKLTDQGNYSVVVSNALGSDESDEAFLSVNARVAFKALAGYYQGLIGGATFEHRSSGFIQIKTTIFGAFSGAMTYGGIRYSLIGRFDADGNAVLVVGSGAGRLTVHLSLDQSGAGGVFGTVTNGGVTADFFADSAGVSASAIGNFTVLLPRNPMRPELTAPQGDGYGAVTVDKFGNLRLRGKLGDGTAISQGTRLTAEGWWAIYFGPYAGSGSVSGWAQFRETTGVSDLDGSLDWSRPELFQKQYPAGFTTTIDVVGSRYLGGVPALNLAPSGFGDVMLENGNLAAALHQVIMVDASNHVIVTQNNNQFSMSIAVKSGVFTGKFVAPDGRKYKASGAILQKQNVAAGVFVGLDQAGSIEITPQIR